MIVFLDFEASSLGKRSTPVEVGWVFETGEAESHLIRPAPDWTDWAEDAAAIHGLSRDRLLAEGTPHDVVARRMVERLTGHDLYATAPSWDGQWLSRLLRAAGLPRHALRLRDTDALYRATLNACLEQAGAPPETWPDRRDAVLDAARHATAASPPAHRALDDARRELAFLDALRRTAARMIGA